MDLDTFCNLLIVIMSHLFWFLCFDVVGILTAELENGGWRPTSPEEIALLDDNICNIDRISISDLTEELFEKEYRLKKPLLITFPNGASDWTNPAFWTEQSFVAGCASWRLPTSPEAGFVKNDRNRTTLSRFRQYIDDIMRVPYDFPIRQIGELGFDVDMKTLKYQSVKEKFNSLRLPPFLTANLTIDKIPLFFGGSRSGDKFHKHAESWNSVIYGRKRWFFYPGHRTPPGGRDPGYASFDWYTRVYPHLNPEDKPLECVQEAGEILYMAESYYHCTMNVVETVNIGSYRIAPSDEVEGLFYQAELNNRELDGEEPFNRDVTNRTAVIETANKILEHWPEQFDVLLRLGQEYRKTGDLDKSMEILKHILTKDQWTVMADLELALDFIQLEAVNTAEALIQEALARNPAQYWAYPMYFDLLQKQNRHIDALMLMLQAEKYLWMYQRLWKLWADTLMRMNNVAAARIVYQTIYTGNRPRGWK